MKLLTLNTWGSRIGKDLEGFIKKHTDADIFLLQEIYNKDVNLIRPEAKEFQPNNKLSEDLDRWLPDHAQSFSPVVKSHYGTSILINKNIEVLSKGEQLVAKGDWYGDWSDPDTDHHRKAQWIEAKINNLHVLFVNVHLTHRPEGKEDSEKRLKQSQKILDLINMFPGPKILAGDFNLIPDTESIRMFERAGYRNLIKEFNIHSTRTELYKKPLRLADYIFTSPEIIVKDFKVLPDVVSDHSPLYLEFEV